MRRLKALVTTISGGLLAVLANTAFCQASPSPKEIFFSDQYLTEARRDVLMMNLVELRLFADTLAACENYLSKDEQIQNGCEIALARYRIEFNGGRAVDRVVTTVFGMLDFIRGGGDKLLPPNPDPVMRAVDITGALKDAATARFTILRQE